MSWSDVEMAIICIVIAVVIFAAITAVFGFQLAVGIIVIGSIILGIAILEARTPNDRM